MNGTEPHGRRSLTERWEGATPSKTVMFWGCAATAAATMAIGFGIGGWVTGGTAAQRVADAASQARATLVADACVERFKASGDFASDLQALKAASYWQQGTKVAEGGWATLAGMEQPSDDAARLCAERLVVLEAPAVAAAPVAHAEPASGG